MITGDPSYVQRGLSSFSLCLRHAYHTTAWFEVPVALPALDRLGLDPLDAPMAQGRGTHYISEEEDRAFRVHIYQRARYRAAAVPVADCSVTIRAPDGELVTRREITRSGLDAFVLTVPLDGKTGAYEVEIDAPGLTVTSGCDLPIGQTRAALR